MNQAKDNRDITISHQRAPRYGSTLVLCVRGHYQVLTEDADKCTRQKHVQRENSFYHRTFINRSANTRPFSELFFE